METTDNSGTLKFSNPVKSRVSNLVAEYEADPNCRADLWISDCLQKGEVTKEERDEFLMTVLTNTWQRAFARYSHIDREARLRELLTWDKPCNGNDIEHTAKVKALQNLQS